MTDRRRRRATPAEDASREDNPFAAPPEGRPDQPWRPRRQGGDGSGAGTDGSGSGSGSGEGSGPDDGAHGVPGSGEGENGSGSGSERGGRSSWGSQWSSRQPGRQSGGFGGPRGGGAEGGGPGGGPGRGLRWDPTDPPQRHARYSLHAGVWGLFFALFSLTEIALLLGALSVYWGISALRGDTSGAKSGAGSGSSEKGRSGRRGSRAGATAEDVAGTDRTGEPGTAKQAPQVPVAVTPAQAAKSRTTAAISGLITATLTLTIVAGAFTLRQVHSDYFTCREDALTQSSREECSELLPDTWWRPLLEEPRESSDSGLGLP